MKVYVLTHVHSVADGEEDVKLIGVYSSREKAQAAIVCLSQAPGFSEALAGFHIDELQDSLEPGDGPQCEDHEHGVDAAMQLPSARSDCSEYRHGF